MNTSVLFRWGGLAAITTAILLAAGAALRYLGSPFVGQSLSFTSTVIAPFAIVALYTIQAERAGRVGFWGFVLWTIGNLLTAVVSFLWVATFAGVGEAHAVVMYAWGSTPILHVAILSAVIGLILFGIATMRAGVLPRWAGALLIVGAVLNLLAEYVPSLLVLYPTATLALGVGVAWMGWTLWSVKGTTAPTPRLEPAV